MVKEALPVGEALALKLGLLCAERLALLQRVGRLRLFDEPVGQPASGHGQAEAVCSVKDEKRDEKDCRDIKERWMGSWKI